MVESNKNKIVQIQENARNKLKIIAAIKNKTMVEILTILVNNEYEKINKER